MPANIGKQIQEAIQNAAEVQDANESSGQKFQLPVTRRPILSTVDTFDQKTQTERFTDVFSVGARPIWNVPRVAVTTEKVGTIKSSAAVNTVSPVLATQAGIISNAITNTTSFSVVPNLTQVIKASGPVTVNFSVNVRTVNANDPVNFAIFRNGLQVSQIYRGSGAANTDFLMTGTYTDNPPLGQAVYDVRWFRGASKATASGKNRTIQVLNLRAQ